MTKDLDKNSKIVIYGKTGQLGRLLAEQITQEKLIFSASEHDFSNINNIEQQLNQHQISAFINAAAYTNVNQAENNATIAFKANAEIPKAIAEYCRKNDIILVHYSTDYVFDGSKTEPYVETDICNPLNVYGKSKLAGEENVKNIMLQPDKNGNIGKFFIFRTSWVFDHLHNNFVTTMIKLAKTNNELKIVSDQIGAPSSAHDLAEATLKILNLVTDSTQHTKNNVSPWGLYHLAGQNFTSWYDFACQIFTNLRQMNIKICDPLNVIPILTKDYNSPAIRPLNSRLDCSLVKSKFGVVLPSWQESLTKVMDQIKHEN